MKLSHRKNVQGKNSGFRPNEQRGMMLISQKTGARVCVVDPVSLGALAMATIGAVYTVRQYKLARQAANSSRCAHIHSATKKQCKGALVTNDVIDVEGIDYLRRICEFGHQTLRRTTKPEC